MIKAMLLISLLANAFLVVLMWQPGGDVATGEKMTCEQSRSEQQSKQATADYAARKDASFADTHQFLRASGFNLRNIHHTDTGTVFVYVATTYRNTCGPLHLPGIDGTIVRISTDLAKALRVTGVN